MFLYQVELRAGWITYKGEVAALVRYLRLGDMYFAASTLNKLKPAIDIGDMKVGPPMRGHVVKALVQSQEAAVAPSAIDDEDVATIGIKVFPAEQIHLEGFGNLLIS